MCCCTDLHINNQTLDTFLIHNGDFLVPLTSESGKHSIRQHSQLIQPPTRRLALYPEVTQAHNLPVANSSRQRLHKGTRQRGQRQQRRRLQLQLRRLLLLLLLLFAEEWQEGVGCG
jgi:hypothetical protein